MYKHILFFSALLIFVQFTQAQDKKHSPFDEEEIQAEKIAFLTDKLDLTVKQAQKFWPVYNEFEEQFDSLQRVKHHKISPRHKNGSDLSKHEMKSACNDFINAHTEIAKVRREYHKQFVEILPIQKVYNLYKAESEFKKVLFKKIRRRKDNDDHR